MTFTEQLMARKGGLLRLKSEILWLGGRGWDDNPGRVCLLVDFEIDSYKNSDGGVYGALRAGPHPHNVVALLIDESLRWIRVAETDVEFL